ncbi:hypothetical protein HN51_047737, partial [Arachis hypogaea]
VGLTLACGNIIVLKTAEQIPLSDLYAANYFMRWTYSLLIEPCSFAGLEDIKRH